MLGSTLKFTKIQNNDSPTNRNNHQINNKMHKMKRRSNIGGGNLRTEWWTVGAAFEDKDKQNVQYPIRRNAQRMLKFNTRCQK